MMRFILAILFCPLIVSLLAGIAEPIASGRAPNFQLIIGMLPIFYIFTLLGLIVFGLPIYYLLKNIGRLNLVNLTIVGGLSGIIYMVIFYIVLSSKLSSFDFSSAFSGFLMGAMSALVFGLLAGIPLTNKQKGLIS